jgi:hypothetical protein
MLTAASAVSEASAKILPSVLNNVQAVGATWMVSSAFFTTYSTTKFLKYSYKEEAAGSNTSKDVILTKASPLTRPALLTLYRFFGSLLLGICAHSNLHIMERIQEIWNLVPAFSLPAVYLFVANYANSIALNRIGISLTYTSKCGIPLITVLLTLLLDGPNALPSLAVLSMLIPVALGIAAASWNSPTYEKWGFLAAMVSCTAQSALNVSCKHAMSRLGVAGAVAQRVMVAVGLAISVLLSLFQIASTSEVNRLKERQPPSWLAVMAATAYHMEYVLSFIFVTLVAPITFGACDAVRRLSIIISGRYMFGGEPFTRLNILGIALALLGALGYSILNAHH